MGVNSSLGIIGEWNAVVVHRFQVNISFPERHLASSRHSTCWRTLKWSRQWLLMLVKMAATSVLNQPLFGNYLTPFHLPQSNHSPRLVLSTQKLLVFHIPSCAGGLCVIWERQGGIVCMCVLFTDWSPQEVSELNGSISSYVPKREHLFSISKNAHLSIRFVSTEERVVPIEVCRSKLSKYLQGVVFRCDKCTFTCSSDESLQQHIEKHNELKPYKCQLCYYETKHTEELDTHLRDEHKVLAQDFLHHPPPAPPPQHFCRGDRLVWSPLLCASQRDELKW